MIENRIYADCDDSPMGHTTVGKLLRVMQALVALGREDCEVTYEGTPISTVEVQHALDGLERPYVTIALTSRSE